MYHLIMKNDVYGMSLFLLLCPYLMGLVRCLAHVINLATQAVIKSHSKSKFYDPSKPDDHIPETSGFIRDVVGLVRAICVKVMVLNQSTEMFSAALISYS